MRVCQHCGARVPNYAGFCGGCGKLVSIDELATHEQTVWTAPPPTPDQTQITVITEAGSGNKEIGYAIEDEDTGKNPAIGNTEEDEEERRRNVLMDFGLPLLADGIAGHPTLNVPTVQGTPQIMGAPTISGTPSIGGRLPSAAGEGAGANPLVLPAPEQVFTGPLTHGSPFNNPPGWPPQGVNTPYPPPGTNKPNPPQGTNKPNPQSSGCMVWLLAAIIVPVIILLSIIGVGLTLLAPTLSLDGSTSVTQGGTLHLHGGHFIPGNSVTCMLDGSIPLTESGATHPVSRAPHITGALLFSNYRNATGQARNNSAQTTIIVAGDGTFSATFVVGPGWKAGQHTIRATEALSPRSATTTFTITGNVQPTSTATSGTTPTATKTAKATPSATPTQTKPGLNAITPNIITFGPISEGYTQPTSTQVTLSTLGTDALNWTATWDTVQAPWLRLNTQSGQIQEPNDQALIVSAVVGTLEAGTYNATILFSSDGKNGQNLSLPVSLTVQAGCLKVTPATLNFTASMGGNNPAAQTLTLNNCGAVGNWSESTTGGAWLLVSPAGGNLNKGANQSIIVSATLANMKAGTYQGQIVFKNGAAQAVVNVIFTVIPLPTLGINTTSFSIFQQCTFSQALLMWQCNVIVLNSSKSAQSNLNWTATSSSAIIIVKPASGTLRPGQTAAIEVDAARTACGNTATAGTITFNGPANSVTVTLTCASNPIG